MSFQKIKIDVSKKENGAFKKVGEQVIHCPTLKDIIPFITSDIKKDDKGADVYEDGMPVYVSDEANWVQGAMLAQVKAQARNKLKSGTADLKEGLKIAEDWAELTAEGVRGQGEGLAIAREAKAAFQEWTAKLGISENAANTLVTLFTNKAALSLQGAGVKDKVKARVEAFIDSLSAEQAERFQRPLEGVISACETTAADATDEL